MRQRKVDLRKVAGLFNIITEHWKQVHQYQSEKENRGFARIHGTTYCILQKWKAFFRQTKG